MTPSGRGAVCVLRVSGPGALAAVDAFFQPAAGTGLASQRSALDGGKRPRYGFWHSAPSELTESESSTESTTPSEDVIIVVRDEDDVEIHCHGGLVARQRIVSDISRYGFAPVSSERWLRNHVPDTSAGAAQRLFPHALTAKCLAVLNWQIHGATAALVVATTRALENGDAAEAIRLVQTHLAWEPLARHLTQPWTVVIFGEPNVGKSSLINRIVGFSRSIVFDEPGTTRDLVRARTAINGWPFEFTDSAGIRAGDSTIEQEGIAWARDMAARADLVIEVRDARDSSKWPNSLAPPGVPCITVANKIDLLAAARGSEATNADLPEDVIATSAVDGTGVDVLLDRVLAQLIPQEPRERTSVPVREATTAQLRQAMHLLERADMVGALELLKALAAQES